MSDEDKPRSTASDKDNAEYAGEFSDAAQASIHGVLVGILAELTIDGEVRVHYPGNLAALPVVARSTVPLSAEYVGREVALLFESGNIYRPIVIGLMQRHGAGAIPGELAADDAIDQPPRIGTENTPIDADDNELIIDGTRIELRAHEQIVLRCGESSITMTRAGKVIIRGNYVSSKSSGANRIRGGSVQIN